MLWLDTFSQTSLIGIQTELDVRSPNFYMDTLHPWIQARTKVEGNEISFIVDNSNLNFSIKDNEYDLRINAKNIVLRYIAQSDQSIEEILTNLIPEVLRIWRYFTRQPIRLGCLISAELEDTDFPPSLSQKVNAYIELWPGSHLRQSFKISKKINEEKHYHIEYLQDTGNERFSIDYQTLLPPSKKGFDLKKSLEIHVKESLNFIQKIAEE